MGEIIIGGNHRTVQDAVKSLNLDGEQMARVSLGVRQAVAKTLEGAPSHERKEVDRRMEKALRLVVRFIGDYRWTTFRAVAELEKALRTELLGMEFVPVVRDTYHVPDFGGKPK